jgi:rhamnose utilization protein RhaD (predicted bifunctional aldolase and dehydrogenase)
MSNAMSNVINELLERSHRLGADPRNTNFAGGNTSAKGTEPDPVTGEDVELLWVKGSGGDLGTLKQAGLAVLRLDRLRALKGVYPGVEREDEMVAAFDYCLHGKGGAAPSIDTAMHGLVEAGHVDHLHPDAGIAIATAADGEELTRRVFGDRVVWVPWRRPGFQLGLDIAAIKEANPQAIGCVLGGHGITAWGDTSQECEARSLEIIRTAEAYLAEHGRQDPFGSVIYDTLPEAERHERAAALFPLIRGLASTDIRVVGHYTDTPEVLDFVSRAEHPRLAALGTSCPDHFLRTKVPWSRSPSGCASCTPPTARSTPPTTTGTPPPTPRPSGARTRRSCWCRASACSPSARTSRPPAWPASSTSTPSTSCAAPSPSRPTPPSPSRRSSASSTGSWRRPSSAACPSPSPWPPGSRW